MLGMKALILLGQVGRIWSKSGIEIKVFQTLTSIAFFALFLKSREKEEHNNNFKTD